MKKSTAKEQGELLDRNTVQFERLLPGSLQLVWDYLTKKELLATWLVDSSIDARPGMAVSLSQDSERLPIRSEGEIRGVITRSEPPRILSYTWEVIPPDKMDAEKPEVQILNQSEVTFELEPRDDKVLLTLTHRRIQPDRIPQAGAGWHAHLDFLSGNMAGKKPTQFFTTYEDVLPLYVRAYMRISGEE